jgi:hypothetical protein
MQLEIKNLLHHARYLPVKAFLDDDKTSESKLGGKYTQDCPISCIRCKSIEMHLVAELGGFSCFCANEECMKIDSDASKTIEREKYRQEFIKKHGYQED